MVESNDAKKPQSGVVSTDVVKSPHALREERILAFWKEKGIFEKSLNKCPEGNAPKGEFIFYDGPPFANGLPHYGHILAGVIKDVVPRWKTMQGYHVPRRWGWDCHGLPVENLVEKELNLKSKKDIVTYGVGRFNEAAAESIMRYADEWRKIVPRLGRWVDMDHDYRTMDATYTESVWWIFKKLHDSGLIYEGFKSMNLCPRCETTLSNFEVAQGYKDITDISVIAKFRIENYELRIKNNGEGQGGDVFFLAWTTTPWTLPGNVALAVGGDVDYCRVKLVGMTKDGVPADSATYILAKARLSVLKDAKYEIVEEFKGSELVGLMYEPLFDYYSKNSGLKNGQNGWKVYAADFVTTEDGTGVVHIAPAFGADDYELLKKHDLPFVQHVAMDGTFKREVTDFAGLHVKPKDTDEEKDAHQKTDIEIIKWLAHHDTLFAKEKLIHSYPHCWRCDTPLLNYAASSWFVKVTEIKDRLVAQNRKVTWVPPEVGEGRFGNWLSGARDWAISRSRFWGAPIPVWREFNNSTKEQLNDSGEKLHVIGSVEDLKKYSRAKNTYYVMRHGQAENNTLQILDSSTTSTHHLTSVGREQVMTTVDELRSLDIDLIITSPVLRTKETAHLVGTGLGLDASKVIVDERVREYNAGIFEGKSVHELGRACAGEDRWLWRPEGGEDYMDIKKRMGTFLYDIETNHEGKNILIVTHETPAAMLFAVAAGYDMEGAKVLRKSGDFMANAECRKLDFVPIPHNADFELDLHRPFIDDIALETVEGHKLVRVPDVFDCWFESGAMPYASAHYPFEKVESRKSKVENNETQNRFEPQSGLFRKSRGFPADFIAEGLDQTRGWFYSMMVLGVALFGKTPYKKVIVNGLVLAEDGEKMSKRKQNYPDPMMLVDKYGADALRYYLLSSPVVHGQDLCFSERGVDEVTKKLVNRLLNVVSFYELYNTNSTIRQRNNSTIQSQNILDRWIIARLDQTATLVTGALETGELDRASRPFMDFIDDLSTWYLRRSRERFKGDDADDKEAALMTTRYVLLETAKLLAPFMPFLAEDIYGRCKAESGGKTNVDSDCCADKESVHLESWPKAGKVDVKLLDSMQAVRAAASKGLEARMKAMINVRQPLKNITIKQLNNLTITGATGSQLLELIKDEVNVKEVIFDDSLTIDVKLDTVITPALKEEGTARELIRAIQDLRKARGLTLNDKAELKVETTGEGRLFIERNMQTLKSATSLKGVAFTSVAGEFVIVGGLNMKLGM